MKRLFIMLVILFAFYLGIQVVFDLFSGGAENEYEIIENENKFYVKENSNFKENNYYFEIATDNNKFNFQIYSDLNRKKSVITNIKYYKNDIYECILPIFKDAILTDVMCMNNNIMYYYHDIKSISPGVDTFVASINNYDVNKEYLVGELGAFNRLKNISCDYSFNVTNSYTVALLHSLGAKRITLSYELSPKQINNIVDNYILRYQKHPNLEMVIYGNREVMCLKTNLNKIYDNDNLYLVDRFNNKYKLRDINGISYIYDYKLLNDKNDYYLYLYCKYYYILY